MKDSVRVGMNRTGMDMSPRLAPRMLEPEKEFPIPDSRSEVGIADIRQQYIRESGENGTVPLPGTMKGAVATGVQKILGKRPEVLIDKLGERMAFERTGVRLYDSLITKCEATLPGVSLDLLRQIREEEAHHYFILKESMKRIGADPTAMPPSANAAGVEAMGLVQVLNDPRTSVAQCVHAILVAELTDNDGWDRLISLAKEEDGWGDDVKKFEIAKANEEKHLIHIRAWLDELVRKNSQAPIQ